MKTYRVFATSVNTFSIDIEAQTKEEAYQKACDADGGDFVTVDAGDWDIESDTIEVVN